MAFSQALAEEGLAEEGLAEEGLAEEGLAEEGLTEAGVRSVAPLRVARDIASAFITGPCSVRFQRTSPFGGPFSA